MMIMPLFLNYNLLTLRTSEAGYRLCANFPVASNAGIPALHKLPCGIRSRYTGGKVYLLQASEVGIPTLFSNAYWHLNARVIEIQTRQQLNNNFSHETQRIFVNKFCI